MWIETYPSEDLTQLVCILKLIMAQNNEYQNNIQLKDYLVLTNTKRLCIRESMLLPEADLTSIRRNLISFFIEYLHYSKKNNCSEPENKIQNT